MPLIIENGSGVAGAASFCSVAYADEYQLARGNAAWAGISQAAKEQALLRATAYMQNTYSQRWYGYQVNNTQALNWPRHEVPMPRYGYFPGNVLPQAVVNACAALALKATQGELAPNLDTQTLKHQKVEVMEVEYENTGRHSVVFREIDNMLASLLNGYCGGVNRQLVRA